MSLRFSFFFLFLLAYIHDVTAARLEPGKQTFTLALPTDSESESSKVQGAVKGIAKSMFNGTAVKITVGTDVICKPATTSFTVGWELRYTRCAQLYTIKSGEIHLEDLSGNPSFMYPMEPEITIMAAMSEMYKCEDVSDPSLHPKFRVSNETTCYVPPPVPKESPCSMGDVLYEDNNLAEVAGDDGKNENEEIGKETDEGSGQNVPEETDTPKRRKREPGNEPTTAGEEGTPSKPGDPTEPAKKDDNNETKETEKKNKPANPNDKEKNVVTHTSVDGSYLLILNITAFSNSASDSMNVSLEVTVDMKSPYGYLSVTQYPLLKFYGIMCGVYTLFGFTWLVLLCRQYQDLLGIQIWIGVVILLGLVEKAAFYGEFEHMNNRGTESSTGILLAELISCMKRTLARLLVVIVSIGYGITRPRLGTDLNYIMAAGLLYMTLSSAEALMRVSESYEHSMVAILPLSVLEAILVWWILRNLVDTTRTLRLRNNETKLWLYRHFTNTLLLCIVFSVIFSIWSMKSHRFSDCVLKHYELWLDDAFWHILFCVILFVVMVLFRPSVNNQRYAYSPLIDEEQDDEESKEPMLSEAYDGMKMRNLKKDTPQNPVKDIADDLKWVEDNIPAAIADSALAIMDDSEEELVTNLERSKMD